MKEVQCKQCGVIFEIDERMPEIACTCKGREFTIKNK